MDESILNCIKKDLGIEPTYDHFDHDIIDLINTSLGVLRQIGVCPDSGFSITGPDETWWDFLGEDNDKYLKMIRTYIYTKVRITFDPPVNSFVLEALKENAKELEWRINVEVDQYLDDESEAEED